MSSLGQYRIPSSRYQQSYRYSQNRKNAKPTDSLRESYDIFALNVKRYLVTESVNYILKQCISPDELNYGKVLCENFVSEQDAQLLLNRFSRTSLMLAELANVVNESFDNIMAAVDKENNLTFTIKQSERDKFFQKLEDVDVSNAVKSITTKVCKAAEEYVQDNINDKMRIDQLAAKAKETIEKVRARSVEQKEKLQQEAANDYRGRVNDIVGNRPRGIYEHMVRKMYNCVLKTDEMKDAFTEAATGKVDVSKIESKVNTAYTFMEMVNTCKMVDVNPTYISGLLKSIS